MLKISHCEIASSFLTLFFLPVPTLVMWTTTGVKFDQNDLMEIGSIRGYEGQKRARGISNVRLLVMLSISLSMPVLFVFPLTHPLRRIE